MESQSYATLEDLAEWMKMTVGEMLWIHPGAQKTLNEITVRMTDWIFPNNPQGHEDCLRQASLYQWDYMHSDAYQASTLPPGISGFSVMSFRVDKSNDSERYGLEYNHLAPLARDCLRLGGLTCRAVSCGVSSC